MDIYTASEISYKNGYSAGQKDFYETHKACWIEKSDNLLHSSMECSHCHFEVDDTSSFCPNCGFLMVEA